MEYGAPATMFSRHMRLSVAVVIVTACQSSDKLSQAAPSVTHDAAPRDAAVAAPPARRWIAGDLHMHVAPIDSNEGQTLDIAGMATVAHDTGLEFVIATPHVHPDTWAAPARRKRWLAQWSQMAAAARAATGTTIIPGVEYTHLGYGHFGVSGVDLTTVGDHFLADASAAGAFVTVNHPFAVPSHIPGVPISEYDLSFHPWTDKRGPMPHLDGVEVWNIPLALANMLRPNGPSGEQRAFLAADELARRAHRRIAITGGSDSHNPKMTATTWVLATDASEPSILAGLHAAATCVGSPAGGSLAAHGDGDPPDRWARIGESVSAAHRVELRWTGHARVFVDGIDAGEHDDRYSADATSAPHTYRIELGTSHCGFIYANL